MMKLMLGKPNKPSLLVVVEDFNNQDNFDFWVQNGNWNGKFQNGFVTVFGAPGGDFSLLDKVEILTQDQDRLRGNYNDVFNNFGNTNYVSPQPKYKAEDFIIDDIPF